MLLRYRAIILLMAILWQSISVLTPMAMAERAVALEHVALHGQDIEHHHHYDKAPHTEDAGGTSNHLFADIESNSTGLLATGLHNVAVIGPLSRSLHMENFGFPPNLEGLLRPPRHII